MNFGVFRRRKSLISCGRVKSPPVKWPTLSPLPKHPIFIRLYLACRPAWRLLGRQFLIVGRKPARSAS